MLVTKIYNVSAYWDCNRPWYGGPMLSTEGCTNLLGYGPVAPGFPDHLCHILGVG